MKIVLFITCLLFFSGVNEKNRTIEYNGQAVKTTFDVPQTFYGTYSGNKKGYLTLKADGTGTYNYDVFGFAPDGCKKGIIEIEWGFLLDDNNKIVSFEREYGRSYPILMESTSPTSFQGCRKRVMLDFIMEYKNGKLGVSSSDDWMKE
ncbi:hypothetical protein C900_01634 [Fulvivirga imtechensis AK7]|uniref:Uncharacterized protein n=1 Tax=Fulvivirga imtechensis AK7 TaxID=1237149 RepID=L8JYS0_9BACT|nr:hypothetical protein [Fulvivirga imtechensis]ELR72352.1 hypothetical protein C900_01634 [Fulvivirga imtechensis AK7]